MDAPAGNEVDCLQIEERADEVRIRISGVFVGASVDAFRRAWERAMSRPFWQGLVVDLSGLTSWDAAGESLLREMYNFGSVFCAPNPRALQFLQELSRPVRSLVGSNCSSLVKSLIPDSSSDNLADQVSAMNSLMRLSVTLNSFVPKKDSRPPVRKLPSQARPRRNEMSRAVAAS